MICKPVTDPENAEFKQMKRAEQAAEQKKKIKIKTFWVKNLFLNEENKMISASLENQPTGPENRTRRPENI